MRKMIINFFIFLNVIVSYADNITSVGDNSPILNNTGNVNINYGIDKEFDTTKIMSILTIYTNKDYIESKLGKPRFTKAVYTNFNQSMYIYDKYYLQLIFDNENKLHFYAISSRNLDFMPNLPFFQKKLGVNTFSDFGQHDRVEYSFLSSKYPVYAEVHYLGRPGKYNYYYFALNGNFSVNYNEQPLGDIDWNDLMTNEKKLILFRKSTKPNTFGVGSFEFYNKIEWDYPWGSIVGHDFDVFDQSEE